MVSFSTQTIAEKDEERDQWGQVIEQVAKQWMRMPDPAMAIHGRRVYQVFQDIGFRASEALDEMFIRFKNPEIATSLFETLYKDSCDIID